MAGLDANKMYKVRELNVIDNTPLACEGKAYSGKFLMEHGLEMPLENNVDWARRLIGLHVFFILKHSKQ